ncbi:MAG: PQQ-binding-like beta-propeller repeat protein [Halobacteriota archaeon]
MKGLSFVGIGISGTSICVLLLASVLLIAVPALAMAEEGGTYPMFHYDAQRTGNVSGDAPMTNQISWSTYIGGLVDSSPIISDGKVFVSNWFAEWYGGVNGLYCLNETTGEILWNNSLGGSGGASTASISGDKLFVGSLAGNLYCINASSGETIWSKRIEHSPAYSGVASSPLVYENLVFVTTFSNNASNNGTLHVLDFNGSELWNLSTGDTFYYTSPAIADGNVFFAGNLTNHTLYCVNISTHNILWLFNTSTQIKSTPAIWNNTVFFASANKMYAVNITDGKELWNNSFSCVMSSPAVSNGRIFVGSGNGRLYCYNADDGSERWNTTVNGPIHSSSVVANNTIYFGTNTADGTIYALNATDGTLRWSYTLNPPSGSYYNIMSSPAVADGILFIGADDGRIHAFSPSGANITSFTIESVSSKKGHRFTARLNITTSSDAVNGWYVVVASGVNADGSSLAGIGTVYLNSNDTVNLMPVLIHVPPLAESGEYELYAGLYRLNNYPYVLMDSEGPIDVTVTVG